MVGRIEKMEGRTIIIGDVHGCAEELSELLREIGPRATDTLVSVGDILDKGRSSLLALRMAREAGVILVLGNHEDKHIRFAEHEARGAATEERNPMKDKGGILRRMFEVLSPEDRAYLLRGQLYCRLGTGDLILHGGIPGSTMDLPHSARLADLHGKERQLALKLLRTRFISASDGTAVRLGEQGPEDPFWAAVYDGRFGKVFFGHDAVVGSDQPRIFPYAVGLDLGCVYGGYLCAAVIERGATRFLSVPSKAKYAEFVQDD